jgi:hypothetical protein
MLLIASLANTPLLQERMNEVGGLFVFVKFLFVLGNALTEEF